MRVCSKCKVKKSKDQFGKCRNTKGGLNYWCKECARKQGAAFRRTEAYKIIKQRYYRSEKGQASAKRTLEKSKVSKQGKARRFVNHAVQNGKIKAAKTKLCHMADGSCNGRMEYHHYKGYAKENWLDVLPLCRKHHCITDGVNYHDV